VPNGSWVAGDAYGQTGQPGAYTGQDLSLLDPNAANALDSFGLSQDEEQWLIDHFGVGGTTGQMLAQLGGYNEQLRQQASLAAVQASYARIAADEAIHAGDLAEAKRYHDMQDQLARYQAQVTAEMDYTKSLMAMGDKPDQLFKYAFARYGMQAPQGGAPAALPLPDFMKQNGMVQNPAQPNGPAGNVQTPISQNPSLAALIPGANPNPQGVVQPTPQPPAVGPGLQPPPPNAALQPQAAAPSLLPSNPTSREVGPFATQPILPHFDIPAKTLGPNTSGPDVVALQRSLERLGYFQLPPGANYGYMGPVTTAAVAKFQQDFGLTGTPGIWDKTAAQALKARVAAVSNQPVGPSLAGVRGADVYQPPQGLPQQGISTLGGSPNFPQLAQPNANLAALAPPTPSMSPGSQPLPGQIGGPTAGQSNAAAQPGPYNFTGATTTLTPALQGLFAQTGNSQSQIPISPPSNYKYPDLGTISGQAYNRLAPSEQGAYQSYEHDVVGKPLADVAGDLSKLAPQGSGLSEPTTFMAGGGLIREPVIGKGLATGRNYAFGEQGPESVSPLSDPRMGWGVGPGPMRPGGPVPGPKKRKALLRQFHRSLMPDGARPGLPHRGLVPGAAG